MTLTVRPTGFASPMDKGRQDYTVYSGECPMGRIYEARGTPEHMRWFWSIFGVLNKPPHVRTDGHAPTLDAAKEELAESWRKWLAWAELSEKAGDPH
jgi:hypothetical protein